MVTEQTVSCIANSLQEFGLASIGSTDDENTKVAVPPTNLEGVEVGHVDSRCKRAVIDAPSIDKLQMWYATSNNLA